MEWIKWFVIGYGVGTLVTGFIAWLTIKNLLHDHRKQMDEEYTKYIKPKYTGGSK